MAQTEGRRDFDRSYKRGAVMGLTVAEAFILLSFCLLLLFRAPRKIAAGGAGW